MPPRPRLDYIENLPWQKQLLLAFGLIVAAIILNQLFGDELSRFTVVNGWPVRFPSLLFECALLILLLAIIGMIKTGIKKLRSRKKS